MPHVVAAAVLSVLLVWDPEIFHATRGFRAPFLDWLTDRIGQLRGATLPAVIALLLMAAGLFVRRRRIRRAGAAMLLTVLLAGLVTIAMKELIGRPGPDPDKILPGESWFDARYGRFPSTHAAVVFGAASSLAAFFPPATVPAFTMAVLVGFERIYRGTHFPSDVFAGIWIGLVVARFVIARLSRRGWSEDIPRRRRASESTVHAWAPDERRTRDEEPAA